MKIKFKFENFHFLFYGNIKKISVIKTLFLLTVTA